MTRRTLRTSAALALLCMSLAAVAATPTPWKPTRPVTVVVPYTPGGGTDSVARAVSKQLSVIWGQPVVIENLPGADGLIGTRKVIDAKPDGTTLLMQVPAIVLTRYTPGLKGVDPVSQLQPITAVAQASNAVVISGKLPAKSLAEFVEYCRRPGQRCSVATTDNQSRIMSRQFVSEEKLDSTVIVNYRGTAAIVTDMIANNVDMAFTGIAAALPHHKTGALRFIATTGDRRAGALPDVATTAEAGFAQYRSVNWFGLFAPRGLPPDAAQGLVAALREAVKAPDVRTAIVAAGAEPLVSTPDEFAAQVKAEGDRLGALVKRHPLE
ncbi:tripartite tricarboxylate transporter substrate binding protein (plasmid) [Variovorax paradoxus]|nr:tripartite tricarboxylate transporter substrate binding protein [Variovorax paradoxus]